jgi:slit protein 2
MIRLEGIFSIVLFCLPLLSHAGEPCPNKCQCSGTVVDCSGQGLQIIPADLPAGTTSLDLSYNHISSITKEDVDSFQSLTTINLAHNGITCIGEESFSAVKKIKIINLSDNKVTNLPQKLRSSADTDLTIFLNKNPLVCNCDLKSFFSQDAINVKGISCSNLENKQKKTKEDILEYLKTCNEDEQIGAVECESERSVWKCPKQCTCAEGVADCRNKKLVVFPEKFPVDTTEIRLEQNQLTEIPPKAFVGYKRLRRIDISNNEIRSIATDAFAGLKSLTSLVLYGNQITSLPQGLFNGLTSLQLLLLNSNRITCISKDLLKDLRSISLLSLYDNRIQIIENGTFSDLMQLQTL